MNTAPRNTARDVRTATLAAVIVVLLVTGATGLYLFYRTSDSAPRLDAPIEEVARFVSDPRFKSLPFERQRRYMEVLDDREDELDQAYRDEKLNATEYRRGLELAWFGKELPRMEKYASLAPAEQAAYIDERVDKKEEKDRKKEKNRGDGGGKSDQSAVAAPSPGPIPGKRDEQSEKDIPRSWPTEWREKWKKYREALKDRREDREEQRESAQQSSQSDATPARAD